ncbi:hypothetical protein PINS_up002553 [Pythium insidiosum]|nr:hypothetical protein PINS_up002553 [Pythium insidiosum]
MKSQHSRHALWAILWALQLICGVYPLLVGLLYVYMARSAQSLLEDAELYDVTVSQANFHTIAAVYFALATHHFISATATLVLSIRHQELRFDAGQVIQRRLHQCWLRTKRMLVRLHPASRAEAVSPELTDKRTISSRLRDITSAAFQRSSSVLSAFDVTDRRYDQTHLVRELLETALQSYQAYKSSVLVANEWMNHVLVLLLVLNCWFGAFLSHVNREMTVTQSRILVLLVNLALDLTSYAVVPIALFLPYYAEFDPVDGSFPTRFWYTDRWLVGILNEWRMLFVTSLWDGLAKLAIAISIARSLHAASSLLALAPSSTSARQIQPLRARDSPSVDEIRQATKQTTTTPMHSRANLSQTRRSIRQSFSLQFLIASAPTATRFEKVGHAFLAVWGTLVLCVHLYAASQPAPPICITGLRPWFSTRATCSLLEIDCEKLGIAGVAHELDASFQSIDTRWVSLLILRHCPRLEFSSALNGFQGLMGLKTYNTTIATWHADGALTNHRNPNMHYVFLVATNMTEFPRGLYEPRDSFPQRLLDIEVCRTNLTTLPMALADSWPQGLFLLFEETQFTEVPPVLGALEVESLSLAMNSFTSIPASVLESQQLIWLQLSGVPLNEFPAHLNQVPTLVWVAIRATNISELPSWLDLSSIIELSAGGSPLCTAASDSSTVGSAGHQFLDCSLPTAGQSLYQYPIEDELAYILSGQRTRNG